MRPGGGGGKRLVAALELRAGDGGGCKGWVPVDERLFLGAGVAGRVTML